MAKTGKKSAIRSAWKKIKRLDPADRLKERYALSGWKAELLDLVVGFAMAALLYYIILPAILSASPPAVVVQSCSMEGSLNVGDIVVLHGVSFEDLNAPLIELDGPVNFSIQPNDAKQSTRYLLFPGQEPFPVTQEGDTIVYISKISGEQIVHRVTAKVQTPQGRYYITKGDANNIPDAAKISCAMWKNDVCVVYSSKVTDVCDEEDHNWAGCIATPVNADEIAGRQLFVIPLIGHIKMLAFHIVTLGHGYPGPMWC